LNDLITEKAGDNDLIIYTLLLVNRQAWHDQTFPRKNLSLCYGKAWTLHYQCQLN